MGVMDMREKEPVPGEHVEDESKKCCVDCQTTKTPLWRGGPAGPKSLCNACGIRFRKRRMSSMIGTNRGCERKREKCHSNHGSAGSSSSSGEEDLEGCGGGSLRIRLMALGEEAMMMQSLPSAVKKQRCQRRRRVGEGEEEEQAAVSLMALSCGSVFA